MKNRFRTKILRSTVLLTGLALLSEGLTRPAFSDDDLIKYGFRASYFICVRDSGGTTEKILDCVKEERIFQDKHLDATYHAYLKNMSPHDQNIENELEDDRRSDLETKCSTPEGSDNSAVLKREICFLNATADKAHFYELRLKEEKK